MAYLYLEIRVLILLLYTGAVLHMQAEHCISCVLILDIMRLTSSGMYLSAEVHIECSY